MAIKEKDLSTAASIGGSDYVRMVTSGGDSKKIEFDDVLPAGGSSGQVLTKNSGTDYDMGWSSPAAGIPAGGNSGQVLMKSSGTDYDATWADQAVTGVKGNSESTYRTGNVNLTLTNMGVHISTSDPTSADGNDGDIWIKY